ncbi:RRQRL motif-containing zinc-binding protein [Streptomyces griseorubiginosus]|uniref:RRQRL motif-containing zinc-binding protein n=1 Tax=Streptomyces griseorubiginosus TaxID=67304 RepID=UPI00114012B9|nr:RRQRL motif-containing zinc-binding protein [Streptomyces griseorubiginosus]
MSGVYGKCFDPTGARHGIPTFPWRLAPDGYATRRQLREKGLRPGGQPIAAQVMRINRRTGGPRVAYLYRVELALPVRPMTSRKWGALALAMLARRTCPSCQLDVGYCISRTHGVCGLCLINLPAQAAA